MWVEKKASAGSKQYFFHNSSFTLDFSVNQVVYGEALIIFSFRLQTINRRGFSLNLSSYFIPIIRHFNFAIKFCLLSEKNTFYFVQ